MQTSLSELGFNYLTDSVIFVNSFEAFVLFETEGSGSVSNAALLIAVDSFSGFEMVIILQILDLQEQLFIYSFKSFDGVFGTLK